MDLEYNGFLTQAIEIIATTTVSAVELFFDLLGVNPDHFGELGKSIAAFLFLIPIIGISVFITSKILRTHVKNHNAEQYKTFNLLITALIRPLAFTIWIYGGFVAIAPLLRVISSNFSDSILFSTVEYIVIGATFLSLAWFADIFIRRSALNFAQTFKDKESAWGEIILSSLVKSLRVIIPLLAIVMFFEIMPVSQTFQAAARTLSSILIIVMVFWVLTQFVLSFDDIILKKYSISETDNLKARKIYTQVAVIQRIGLVIIGFISFASILLLFPNVRQFGQTILASAGVAGLIIGFAMQRTLSNLFAGIQIAFTQPIRIDDVVIVENEWGWIEEITLTYVVVKIWDWRRLVLPISYFIERPFQNWTRTSASIMGSVIMHVDYRINVPDLRSAMEEEVKKHPLWDKRVYCLQVTECRERTVEVRILVSAVDSPKAWDLRCDIREAMLTYIQKKHPESLPQVRIGPQMSAHGKEMEVRDGVVSSTETLHLDLEKTAAAE